MDSLRLGIVGVGCIGQEHLRNGLLYNRRRSIHQPRLTVAAVAEPHARSVSDAKAILGNEVSNTLFFSSVDSEGFWSEIDCVLICTPNHLHLQVLQSLESASASLKRPIHIFAEKPLCHTPKDSQLALDLLTRLRKRFPTTLLHCNMEYRFIPSVAELLRTLGVPKHLLATSHEFSSSSSEFDETSSKIGSLHQLFLREHRFPFLKKVDDWNRFSRNTGGTLVEKCCHFFDLMRLVAGAVAQQSGRFYRPHSIYAVGGQDVEYKGERYGNKEERPDIHDNAFAVVEFRGVGGENERPLRCVLDLCMFAETSRWQEEVSVTGSLGKVEAFCEPHGWTGDSGGSAAREPNFRLSLRDAKDRLSVPSTRASSCTESEASTSYARELPPPVRGDLSTSSYIAPDPEMVHAGHHLGSTFFSLERFVDKVRKVEMKEPNGETNMVDYDLTEKSGFWAVVLAAAAEESIRTGEKVSWTEFLAKEGIKE